MANKIQIKRSTANATVTGLANGELAFTQASNTLHIGLPDGSGTLRIGGAQYPGTLTNSHALVANATGYIDEVRTANAVIDKIYANGTHGTTGSVLSVDSSGEIYWSAAVAAAAAGSNTQVQYNASGVLGASGDFTFDSSSNTLSVSKAAITGNVSSSNTTTGSLTVTGGVGVTGRLNVTDIAVGNDSVYSSVNSTVFTGTANNATYAYGKTEGNLNVNSALTSNNSTYAFGKSEGDLNVNSALTSNNSSYAFGKSESALNVNSALTSNNSTYAFGKSESDLNVNSALTSNNSTYAFGKSENALNVNNAVTANDASYLGGSAAADYAKLAGNQTFTGNNTFSARVILNGAVVANGSTGSGGQLLASNGSNVYWTDTTSVSSVAANSLTSNAVTINDTIAIGNSTVNVFANSTTLSISDPTSSVSLNSSAFSGTANNATYAYGKSESGLNVNSALTSNNSTYAFGKTENALNVNSAVYVTANDGIVSNSSGVFVKAGTGVTVNATGVHIGQPVGTTDNVTFNDIIINGNAALGSSTSDVISINGVVNTDIIPSANVTYSLGNTTNRWNDLYLSGSTIYLGNASISETGDGGVSVGNLNITTTADIADLTVTGNTKLGNSFGTDVVSFVSTVNTNISPAANITYDLGQIDLRWRAVYANSVNATAAYISGDLQVGGNVYVTGNVTSLNVTSLAINDPLIQLAVNNEVSDLVDIGFYGHYSDDSGTTSRHAGLFRDASDGGVFKIFTNLVQAGLDAGTDSIVNTAAASYVTGTLVSYLNSGAFVSNSSAVTITANSSVAVSITANTLTLSSPLAGTSGGTGLNSFTAEDVLVANSSNGFRKLGLGTAGYVLQSNGSALVYDTLDGGTF